MKHLNPRQGITTRVHARDRATHGGRVKHLNPRQGITTSSLSFIPSPRAPPDGVKHLNPRQGITTEIFPLIREGNPDLRVKHLNPRQGITTQRWRGFCLFSAGNRCETPKSPPGDYNPSGTYVLTTTLSMITGVKHLNPRQGITPS